MRFLILVLFLSGCSVFRWASPPLEKFNLKDYQGKNVLLHFYAPYCYTCLPEINELKKSAKWFNDHNWKVIIVGTLDETEAIRLSLKDMKLPFTSVIDYDFEIAKRFLVDEIPYTVLVDKDGNDLQIFDPKEKVKTSRFRGARSWNSMEMLKSLSGN